jgi:hypothetical protein
MNDLNTKNETPANETKENSSKQVYFNGEPIEKTELLPIILGALWALMPPILLILATFSILLWIIFIR